MRLGALIAHSERCGGNDMEIEESGEEKQEPQAEHEPAESVAKVFYQGWSDKRLRAELKAVGLRTDGSREVCMER